MKNLLSKLAVILALGAAPYAAANTNYYGASSVQTLGTQTPKASVSITGDAAQALFEMMTLPEAGPYCTMSSCGYVKYQVGNALTCSRDESLATHQTTGYFCGFYTDAQGSVTRN